MIEGDEQKPSVHIPVESLNDEILEKLISHFITREGTDYGAVEVSHEKKVQQVRRQLSSGKVKLVFNSNDESVTLVTDLDWKKFNR